MIKRKIHALSFWLASNLRYLWVLKLVRRLNSQRLAYYFDPNNIRQHHRFEKKPLLALVRHRKELGEYQIDLNDHVGFTFFMEGSFDDALLWASERLGLTEKDAICDVGANLGTVSIPCAVKHNCELFAFEASLETCRILCKNIAHNNVKAKLFPFCIVSPEDLKETRWINLNLNDGNRGANSIFRNWNQGVGSSRVQICPTNSVESCLTEADISRVRLIKIDIEGAEDKAIKGLLRLRARSVPILMEYRLDLMPDHRIDAIFEMVDTLEETYLIQALEHNDTTGYFLSDFDRNSSYENILAMPKSRSSMPSLREPS